MLTPEIRDFLAHGTRTGKLGFIAADGRPLVAPVWFVVEGDELLFNTGSRRPRGGRSRRDPRLVLCVDLEEPPYAYVQVQGVATVTEDPASCVASATLIGGRYMGADRAEEFGRRNAVPGELLVRLRPTKVVTDLTRDRLDSAVTAGSMQGGAMTSTASLARYRVGDLDLTRIGYGAMQLAGPRVFGPPKDHDAAISGAAGRRRPRHQPHRHRRLLRPVRHERAHPRGAGAVPGGPAHRHQGRRPARRAGRLAARAHARRAARAGPRQPAPPRPRRRSTWSTCAIGGLEAPEPGSIAEQFTALAELQQQGLIRHLGLSTVNAEQLAEAQSIAPVVCVQNMYNIARRADDALVDRTAQQGIAFVPYFPLGGFNPVQSDALQAVADRLGATPHGDRAGLAAAPLAQHPADPRHRRRWSTCGRTSPPPTLDIDAVAAELDELGT